MYRYSYVNACTRTNCSVEKLLKCDTAMNKFKEFSLF